MAVSFSRPDPSSPASVADAGFNTGRRGFDQQEVRDFLRMVAAELGRLQERERFLERELRSAQSNPDLSAVELDDQDLTRLLGEETARVLTTARESAAEIRQKAEQSAAQLLAEAADDAARLREEAEVEASRRRSDAANDAEAELAMAKQQGREMVNEARAYRERVLSELARRRELARQQIEQLLHGRDRLMESFERARLAAVDVVAELQPLGEPDEYVDLTPTTGPVPVMVPNAPAPTAEAAPAAPVDEPAPSEEPAAVESTEHADDDEPAATDSAVESDTVTAAPEEAAATEAEQTETEHAETEQTEDASADEGATAGDDGPEQAEADADSNEPESTEPAGDATDEPAERAADDDVVVDLFARLRSETETHDDDATDEPVAADATTEAADDAVHDEADPADEVEPEPTPFEERDAELTPLIVASARKLKRVLADEQNEVLDTLRRNDPVTQLDALLPSADEHADRYAAAISDELSEAVAAGGRAAGRSRALRKADTAAAIDAASAVMSEWLVAPLRERIERCVGDGGGDNADITRRVRSVYREWKTQHIDEQLDDVVRWAHGGGVAAGFEPDTQVVWVGDPDAVRCADCDDNTLAGALPIGSEFPTGHLRTPAHVGCRCLLLPADR